MNANDLFKSIDNFIKLGLEYTVFNIFFSLIVSMLVARIGFYLNLIADPSLDSLVSDFKKIDALRENSFCREFIWMYCLSTGIIVVSVLHVLGYSLDIDKLVLLSFFGPYFIKDRVKKFLDKKKVDCASEAFNAVDKNLEEEDDIYKNSIKEKYNESKKNNQLTDRGKQEDKKVV